MGGRLLSTLAPPSSRESPSSCWEGLRRFLWESLARLDLVRMWWLARLSPLSPHLLRDRERRIAVYGLVALAFAFAATFAAPMLLLAVGPLLLGVPHLVADVRYLVARPGLHRRASFWWVVAPPAIASFVHPRAWLSMLAVVGAAVVARAPRARRVTVAVIGAMLVLVCVEIGRAAELVLAHAHNAIAIGFFWVWSRRRHALHQLVVAGFAACVAAIGLGAFDGGPTERLLTSRLDEPHGIVEVLAPLSDPVVSARLVLVFAFAQSVHYAVWVRLVPEEDRPRAGLRSFSSSARAVISDLGTPFVVGAAILAVGLAVWGCIELTSARDGYLRIAVFHGPLELGAGALLLLERGRMRACS